MCRHALYRLGDGAHNCRGAVSDPFCDRCRKTKRRSEKNRIKEKQKRKTANLAVFFAGMIGARGEVRATHKKRKNGKYSSETVKEGEGKAK